MVFHPLFQEQVELAGASSFMDALNLPHLILLTITANRRSVAPYFYSCIIFLIWKYIYESWLFGNKQSNTQPPAWGSFCLQALEPQVQNIFDTIASNFILQGYKPNITINPILQHPI